ncbi:MAG: O-antigen ligase family protein [Ginsengibacter sp.]
MDHYSFKKIIRKDKVLLLFFSFLFVNFFSYAVVIWFGTTLIPVRIGILVILLLVLLRDKLQFQTIDTINNKYVAIFLFFYSCSFVVNLTFSDPLFFFSLIISVIVLSLFIDYLFRHYPVIGDRILLDIIFYSLLFFPLILILNPWYISLNLYGSESIERLGIKSRVLGWSCAVIYGILLYQFKYQKPQWWKKAFLIILFFFIIISGSRSSLLGVVIVSILYFINQKNKIKYLLVSFVSVLVMVLLFSNKIGKYADEVSFQKREEAKTEGVSDESYRGDVLADALKISWENIGGLVFGFGSGQFKKTLSKYNSKYRYNELSSHDTYLEVFITSGLLSFIGFLFLYLGMPLKKFFYKKKDILYVFIPIVLIAATEDNFGLGQFLFVIFSLLAFYSFKI